MAVRSDADGYVFTVVDTSIGVSRDSSRSIGLAETAPAPAAPAFQVALPPGDSSPVRDLFARLAPREVEIVTELLNGYRAPGIARRLFLSAGTVRNHLSAAYRKLGVKGQQELIELFRNVLAGTDASK